MRTIDEINPENFGCFYFSQLVGEISVHMLSPDGDIEYFEYEAFSCDNGTIIAFNSFNPQSTDYSYLLKCGQSEELIQFQLYENLKDIIDGMDNRKNSFYAMFGSKSVLKRVEEGEHLFIPLEEHCDRYIYGPAPFYELTDGVSETLLDFSTFNSENIIGVFPVLAIQGEACILRVKMNEEDGSYRNYPAVTAIAKTLAGLLRMACEWRTVTKEPFNNDEFPALKMSAFLDQLGIDENIEQQIRSLQAPMHVEKFITDPANARDIIEENGNIPDELKELIKNKVRYLTLNSLSENTNFNPSEAVLLKEKQSIESAVYSFMIYNNMDTSVASIDDVIENLKTTKFLNLDTNALNIYDYLEKLRVLWNQ